MIADLERVLDTPEFEENGGVVLAAARWAHPACELVLDVRTGDEARPREAWRVRCADTRASRLASEWVDSPYLADEHPLLLPYVQRQAKLYVRGRAADARLVVADLYAAHAAVTGLWYPFEAFFNSGGPHAVLLNQGGGLPLAELLGGGSGLLAEGAVGVLAAYAAVLEEHDIEPSVIGERPPLRWLDGAWQPEATDLRVLVLGESYVLGAGFTAERLPLGALDADGPGTT